MHLRGMTLRLLCPLLILGAAFAAVLHNSPGNAAEPAATAAAKRKILFFSKSSGSEHSVISWKNGQPSWAEL